MKLVADDVQTVVLPGTGHWVAEQAPEELLNALTVFLAPYRDGTLVGHDSSRLAHSLSARSRQPPQPADTTGDPALTGGVSTRAREPASSYAEMAASSGSAPRSAKRELMPSFRKILRMCHSTVRGLRNSRAPIAGFDNPLLASVATSSS